MTTIQAGCLAAIGNTPLVRLNRIYRGSGTLLAKAEYLQPGGSVKDRAALAIIELALADETLQPGQPVVEMTSGNMGAGLAVVCNVLGHHFTAVMSAGNSPQRAHMLERLGADVHLVPQVDGSPGRVTGADIAAAVEAAIDLSSRQGGFYVDQFNHQGSLKAHFDGTGPEIWRQLEGQLDGFVAAVGSSGTFTGTSRYLKSRNPELFCAAVEPLGAEVLAKKPLRRPAHRIQGIGYGLIPPHWDPTVCDRLLAVDDERAVKMAGRLAREEGLFVGYSAAANICAAIDLLKSGELAQEATLVTILCDSGFKYAG